MTIQTDRQVAQQLNKAKEQIEEILYTLNYSNDINYSMLAALSNELTQKLIETNKELHWKGTAFPNLFKHIDTKAQS